LLNCPEMNTVIFCFAGLASLIVALLLAVLTGDAAWASRTGALIVCGGLFLGWRRVLSEIDDDHPLPNLPQVPAQWLRFADSLRNDFRLLQDGLRRRDFGLEVAILVAGTLVWGFADIPAGLLLAVI